MNPQTVRRAMTIFIGIIMVSSAVGYALIFQVYSGKGAQNPNQDQQQQTQQEILTKLIGQGIVDRELTPSEKVFVLRNGLVLAEAYGPKTCMLACPVGTDCEQCRKDYGGLEGFVKGLPGYVVLEQIEAQNSSYRFIGSNGKPVDIESFEQEKLLDIYCRIAAAAPRDCLFRALVNVNTNSTTRSTNESSVNPTAAKQITETNGTVQNSTTKLKNETNSTTKK